MKPRKLIQILWRNIENGTIDQNFFELREKVREVLKTNSDRTKAGHQLIAWRKANGKLNIGRPAKVDWQAIIGNLKSFKRVKDVAIHYGISEKRVYEVLRTKGIKIEKTSEIL